MDDEAFSAAFNGTPSVDDGFSKAFNTAAGKQTPMPWEKYGYIKNPAEETGMTNFALGVNAAAHRGYAGLKGLFKDLTPAELAELEAQKSYIVAAPWQATAGQMTAQAIPEIAAVALAPESLLARLTLSGGTAAALEPEKRGEAAAYGAGGQLVGEGVTKGLGTMFRGPSAAPGVREFVKAGGEPTIGQALGGTTKAFEEKLSALPFLGGHINEAQKRSLESFNTSTLQGIVDTLNKGIRTAPSQEVALLGQAAVQHDLVDLGKIKPDSSGYKAVKKAASKAYDNLALQTSGEMTPELATGIQSVKDLAEKTAPEDRYNQIVKLLDYNVIDRFKEGQRLNGTTLKEMLTNLRLVSEDYIKSPSADERRVGTAAKEAASLIKQMMEVQNPRYAEALSAADNAYRDAKRMETAMTSNVNHEMATPASLLQALRGRNRAGFAEGEMPMQVEARRAQEIIGNKLPSSGTAERLNASRGFNELAGDLAGAAPGALLKYYGGAHFYSPEVQKMLVEQTLKQPGPTRAAAARGLSRISPYIGAAGAGAAQQGGR